MNLFKINSSKISIRLKRESSLSTSMKGSKEEPDIVLERLKKLRKLNEVKQRRLANSSSNSESSSNIIIDDNMETNGDETVIPNISTHNKFSQLNNLTETNVNDITTPIDKNLQPKVPPIVVQNIKYIELTELLTTLGSGPIKM